MQNKIIFMTGGVLSSLGKGVAAASIGNLLQRSGFDIKFQKLGPYLNIDPGTMSPDQHGEVFVTIDGIEIDMDGGHYERFTDIPCSYQTNYTTGQIYQDVINREREGRYLGQTVQIIPHITDMIKEKIIELSKKTEILIVEIGGTVGDIESLPFIEAIRQIKNQIGKENTCFVHLTYVPFIKSSNEYKTKPTQNAVKELRRLGIQPDILLCRVAEKLSDKDKDKISLFCDVDKDCVISAVDVECIYRIPEYFKQEQLNLKILYKLSLKSKEKIEQDLFYKKSIKTPTLKGSTNICIIGKYKNPREAYKSLFEALHHAAIQTEKHVNIEYINANKMEFYNDFISYHDKFIIPGGFDTNGIDNIIKAIKIIRICKRPLLGLCLGMQLMTIEYALNIGEVSDANSLEFDKQTLDPIFHIATGWANRAGESQERDEKTKLGGTMRLGQYPFKIQDNTLLKEIYKADEAKERHRHRYEFNNAYKEHLEERNLIFSGISDAHTNDRDCSLVEAVELKDQWWLGVQFHPEFQSTLRNPHPIFCNFLESNIWNHQIYV